jgi:hypothetical protein
MPMERKYIRELWELIKGFRNHSIWGVVVLVPLLIGLYLKCSDIILAVTALIIFFYTFETYKMRKAIVDNTEITIKPVLVLDIDFGRKIISLQNFSNFPAYNVEFDEIDIRYAKEYEKETFPGGYKFEPLDVIPPKSKKEIQIRTFSEENKSSFFSHLTPYFPSRGEEFYFKGRVIYNDIWGKSWKTTLGYSSISRIISGMPERANRKYGQKNGAERD